MENPISPVSGDIAVRFDRLWQLLNRKYHLQQVKYSFGGNEYLLYKITNLDDVLNAAIQKPGNANEYSPYWAELWPASLALAQFLSRCDFLNGKKCIELGCGLGLAGIAARGQGADVRLSDIESDALRMAELNWIVNFRERAKITLLDWRNISLKQQFDVVLAADVAYESELFEPLIQVFKTLLKPGGNIYLSEPDRPIAHSFFAMLDQKGFVFKRVRENVKLAGKNVEISIYDISYD